MDGASRPAAALTRLAATLAITAAAAVAFIWPRLAEVWIYERPAILGGQVWRLWTGHLVHYSLSHLLLDVAVFVAAGGWLEWIRPRAARWFYLLAPPAISLALLVGEPTLARYAGLSGVATGVLVLLALVQWRRDVAAPVWFWPAVLALVALKVGLEMRGPTPLFARFDPDIRVVPLAHLGGIACAGIAYVGLRWRDRRHAA